ncbi:MAG: nucleoside hydrolase [bacterium]|nr:MAG: nucleoside hydrolase [bacterium]
MKIRTGSLAAALSVLALVLAPLRAPGYEDAETSGDRSHIDLIVDTDMGLDDVRAVLALLADTTVEISGIVTVEGSASGGKGLDNLLGLLESMHAERIPVCRGTASPDLEPPPWRETANALGGAAFPPPRTASPVPNGLGALERRLEEAGGEVWYLALGPLGNLARLLSAESAGRSIHTILIPVRITGDEIRCWNLTFDTVSTERVFAGAERIVLIDLTEAAEVDAVEILSTVEGTTPASRWIGRHVSCIGRSPAHLAIFDEIAAVAAGRPSLRKPGGRRFSITSDGGTYRLRPDSEGNVRVAAITDPALSVQLLTALWSRPVGPHDHHPDGTDNGIPAGVLIETFHGHLGPYVVLGYRMGQLALESLGSRGHFGISASVHSVLEPPRSCLIDGIQLGSGCTLGKRNIEIHGYDGPAYAVFSSEGGETVTIRLLPAIETRITRLVDVHGVKAAGERLLNEEIGKLFVVERASPCNHH